MVAVAEEDNEEREGEEQSSDEMRSAVGNQ